MIHHREHVLEAAVGLAHEVTNGTILLAESHHGGGAGVDAHLVLDRAHTRSLRSPRLPSALTRNFGAMNSEMPFTPGGASGRRASTRWMMFSAMSYSPQVMKILVPEDRIAAVTARFGLGAHRREVGTRLRFGEVHGTGPGAGNHVGEKGVLELVGAVMGDRLDRAQRQHLAQRNDMLADFHISSTAVDTVTGRPCPRTRSRPACRSNRFRRRTNRPP